ncbi:large neutral amino acids transporter small subunit 1-like [Babylonia areolata]|uniref:large neutral amino acids transporter small subunit 1-like n=1 Tax=Babylonia areolata TaxID=304850 RepID=UPI003FD62F4F
MAQRVRPPSTPAQEGNNITTTTTAAAAAAIATTRDSRSTPSSTTRCSSSSSFSSSTLSTSPSVRVSEERVELRKQIDLFNCVTIIVGIIIGSGIFISPVGILSNVRSVGMSCVMWAVCGLYSLLCALCFAELGATFPESGGEYLYIMRAFGDFPAFLCLWVNFFIINPVGQAASSLIFATYILRPVFPTCEAPTEAVRIVAALVMALLISVNCVNVKWATKIQGIITASKLIALITIIVIGFVWMARGKVDNFQRAFEGSDYSGGAIAIAFYSGFWAFGGWNYLNFLTSEVINPHRNLPLGIFISMVIITSVYITANVAYFAVLTPSDMLLSSAVAVTFSERTVPMLSYVMPVLIAVSVAGGINGSVLSMSRLFFTAARYNHLPQVISMITVKNLTPAPSLMAVLVLTILMQTFGEIFYLIEMMGFGFAVVLTTALAGLIKLRVREPALPRPIRLPLALPIFLLIVSLLILTLTVYRKPHESGICLLLVAAGIPFYFVGSLWTKPRRIQSKIDAVTAFLQKLMIMIPEETGHNRHQERNDDGDISGDITSSD